jgi:hypothetical protein
MIVSVEAYSIAIVCIGVSALYQTASAKPASFNSSGLLRADIGEPCTFRIDVKNIIAHVPKTVTGSAG